MGYSNNKWRKILTILMIINLCFVLFAKFTKVFGATFESSNFQSEIEVPDWLNDYNFYVNCLNNGGGYYRIDVGYVDPNYKIYYWDTGAPNKFYYINSSSNVTTYSYSTGLKSKSQVKELVKNITPASFTSSTSSPVGSSTPLVRWIQANYASNYDFHHNFTSYVWGSDEIHSNPDIVMPYRYPHFDNVTEIENGYPDGVFISRGDYPETDNLYFHLLKIDYTVATDDGTVYYYSPKIFMLNKDSKYYRTWGADVDNDYSYYYVNRYYLNLDPNARYLYVLSNSSESFNNSVGLIEEDKENGIYHVISSNTTGVVTSQDSTNDKIQNIEDNMTDTTPDPNIDNDISSSFDYDNSNTQLDNAQGGFFSRLMSLFSSMYDYDITEVTTINVPLPHTQKVITLRSDIISSHIVDPLKSLITAFWAFVFYMYGYKFLNYIFIEIKEGKILDGDSLNNCPGTLQANIF